MLGGPSAAGRVARSTSRRPIRLPEDAALAAAAAALNAAAIGRNFSTMSGDTPSRPLSHPGRSPRATNAPATRSTALPSSP